ncbi:hypothetical protein LCGC14_0458440 [marine sediment metagenome]|uniref:Uncharacterized protein n=1 Tax=marine sediment metagenome TaxID=412755 RepID=A0A0F9SFM7_9ZZZZ
MVKLTEKQLYQTWLDIYYAEEISRDYLHDFEIEIKLLRKQNKKNKKMLKQAEEHYEKVYGYKPKKHK